MKPFQTYADFWDVGLKSSSLAIRHIEAPLAAGLARFAKV
jgi:hypothetical protein